MALPKLLPALGHPVSPIIRGLESPVLVIAEVVALIACWKVSNPLSAGSPCQYCAHTVNNAHAG